MWSLHVKVNAVAEKLEETELSLEQSQTEKEALITLKMELEAEIERLKLLLTQRQDAMKSLKTSSREENAQSLSDLRADLGMEVNGLNSIIADLKAESLRKDEIIIDHENKFEKSVKDKQDELHDVRAFLQSDVSRLELELQETTSLLSQQNNRYLLLQEDSRKVK